MNDVSAAGAAAVIGVIGSEVPWSRLRGFLTEQSATRLQSAPVPAITGTMPLPAAQSLLQAAGGNLERLLNEQPGSSFRAVQLPLRLTLDVRTNVSSFTTANVVGRVRGSGSTGQSVMFLAHWDHLGLCRPEGIADRICNGAVDNASGVATLIELGRQVDTDDEANVMVQRQDGWKLNQAGIPTIMVSGSFSDMRVLGGFLQSNYHQPDDSPSANIVLDGAVEDANLMVALARRLADPAVYQRPRS
jgi:Iap family predicted aminopeptidase